MLDSFGSVSLNPYCDRTRRDSRWVRTNSACSARRPWPAIEYLAGLDESAQRVHVAKDCRYQCKSASTYMNRVFDYLLDVRCVSLFRCGW